jgi:hypothetical protein
MSDISIYAYGTQVNSQLSDDILRETGGVYGYMPDASFIGDLLEHKVANIRTTRSKGVFLHIKTAAFMALEGYVQHIRHERGVEVPLHDVLYAQSRDLIILTSLWNLFNVPCRVHVLRSKNHIHLQTINAWTLLLCVRKPFKRSISVWSSVMHPI